jgi:septum formation protein
VKSPFFSELLLGGEELVLASRSPRRAELLRLVGARFRVEEPGEEPEPGERAPEDAVVWLARQKAAAVARNHPHEWVLAADTLVFQDGELLGKPRDEAEAHGMLRRLSGTWHAVYTGLSLCRDGRSFDAWERSGVCFVELTDRDITRYIATGEPMDKAGAYGIQGFGALWVERVEGCYFNVMGLPLARLARLFREATDALTSA